MGFFFGLSKDEVVRKMSNSDLLIKVDDFKKKSRKYFVIVIDKYYTSYELVQKLW